MPHGHKVGSIPEAVAQVPQPPLRLDMHDTDHSGWGGEWTVPGFGADSKILKLLCNDWNDQEKSGGMQKMLQQAFPADKMQISIDAAKSFASSGFDKVLQEATKVSDKVAEVDFVQGARTLAQKTDQAMQRGVHEVRSLPGKRPKVRDMVNAIEQRMQVSNITGAASTKARALGQDLQPGLKKTAAALQPGLERTAQAVEIAKERAGEFAEQMKPRIIEAHENAKKKICKAASEAAATAAWFQTQHHVLQKSEMPLQ